MQTVTSVANPLFGVKSLTSSAASTVKRTRVAIPANQEGTYSHRQSSGRYIAQVTMGSNQEGIISANTCLEMDITPTWWDNATVNPANYPDNLLPRITPSFDQDVTALISRFKIGTPQGLVLEEITQYNVLCNILNAYSVTPERKNQNLISLSSYSKDLYREKGQNPFIDATIPRTATQSVSLRHGVPTRIQIPLNMSSFLKACPFIPLFLLRNGLLLEWEFEDPYRAFVLQDSIPTHKWRIKDVPVARQTTVDIKGVQTPRHVNFLIGPGSLYADGSDNLTSGQAAGAADWKNDNAIDGFVPANRNNLLYPPYWRIGQTYANNRASVNNAISPAPGCSIAGSATDKRLQYCKNFIYVNEAIAREINETRHRLAQAHLTKDGTNIENDEVVVCIPIVLRRDGVPYARFFTALSLHTDSVSYGRAPAGSFTANGQAAFGFTPAIDKVQNIGVYTGFNPYNSVYISMQGATNANDQVNNLATWPLGDPNFLSANADANDKGWSPSRIPQTVGNFTLTDNGYQTPDNSTAVFQAPGASRRTGTFFVRGCAMSVAGDDTADATRNGRGQMMFAYPVYTWDHFDTPTSYKDCRPVFPIPKEWNVGDVATFWRDFAKCAYTLDVGIDSAFQLRLGGDANSGSNLLSNQFSVPPLYDTKIMELQHILAYQRRLQAWDYTISNIRVIADMCQPSSDVFAEYSKAFQSRIGIPYAISRIMTVDRTFDVGTNGAQQFVVPISARSLKMLLITLDDPYFQNYIRGTHGSMYTPFLSSFMRRGLVSLTVTIGGAQKPEYTLRFDKNGGVEHIIETGSAFGIPFVSGFTPQFNREALMPSRNYFAASNFDISTTSFLTAWTNRNFPPNSLDPDGFTLPKNLGIDYIDSSKFIIAIPLARTDAFNFAAGLDSTMTANIILTFTFGLDGQPNLPGESVDPGMQWNRQIHVTVRGDVDAVATLNNDQSTLRW